MCFYSLMWSSISRVALWPMLEPRSRRVVASSRRVFVCVVCGPNTSKRSELAVSGWCNPAFSSSQLGWSLKLEGLLVQRKFSVTWGDVHLTWWPSASYFNCSSERRNNSGNITSCFVLFSFSAHLVRPCRQIWLMGADFVRLLWHASALLYKINPSPAAKTPNLVSVQQWAAAVQKITNKRGRGGRRSSFRSRVSPDESQRVFLWTLCCIAGWWVMATLPPVSAAAPSQLTDSPCWPETYTHS